MAQGKKRAMNEKAKLKRARSWQKNQVAKKARVAQQEKQEARNRELGSTGKQRANQAVKQARGIDAFLARREEIQES